MYKFLGVIGVLACLSGVLGLVGYFQNNNGYLVIGAISVGVGLILDQFLRFKMYNPNEVGQRPLKPVGDVVFCLIGAFVFSHFFNYPWNLSFCFLLSATGLGEGVFTIIIYVTRNF